MFRTCLLAAVVVCLPAVATAQTNRAAVAKQIEAMERALNTAVQKGDMAAFMANVAEDAVTMDGNGAMTIAEFNKMFSQIKMESFTIDQVKVTFLTDNAAVITYRWTGKGSMMSMAFPSPTWSSTTWVNRGGKWVAVFHQETPAAPPMQK